MQQTTFIEMHTAFCQQPYSSSVVSGPEVSLKCSSLRDQICIGDTGSLSDQTNTLSTQSEVNCSFAAKWAGLVRTEHTVLASYRACSQ